MATKSKTKKPRFCLKSLENFLNEKAKELRKNRTDWEIILYNYLKQLGYKFKFQQPIICSNKFGYIVDFLLTDYNIYLEADGKWHNSPEQKKKDNRRTKRLLKEGYHIIRLANKQISTLSKENIDQIIKTKISLINLGNGK